MSQKGINLFPIIMLNGVFLQYFNLLNKLSWILIQNVFHSRKIYEQSNYGIIVT